MALWRSSCFDVIFKWIEVHICASSNVKNENVHNHLLTAPKTTTIINNKHCCESHFKPNLQSEFCLSCLASMARFSKYCVEMGKNKSSPFGGGRRVCETVKGIFCTCNTLDAKKDLHLAYCLNVSSWFMKTAWLLSPLRISSIQCEPCISQCFTIDTIDGWIT